MADLIDRYELLQEIECNKTSFIGTHDEVELHDKLCDYAIDYVCGAPAVDAIPVKVIEKWLYTIAANNVGCPLGDSCEEIIRRLNGLRQFYDEWKE